LRVALGWLNTARARARSNSLKPIDIEFMKRLHSRVNLIPVIAKSDTMTDEEIMMFKRRVRSVGAL
jgi:septin family protein